jgi:hypothetical protein
MRVRYSFSSKRTGLIEGRNDHKQPFPKIVRDVIRMSDIILEIVDIRYIEKTRNSELEKMVSDEKKSIIYILNKADLVNITDFKKNKEISKLDPYVIFSCKDKTGKGKIIEIIKIAAKRLKLKREVYVGIIGYPNTGKSSFINLITGRKSAKTSSESGFTKGIQKIRLNRNIYVLDTPGIIPNIDDSIFNSSLIKKNTEIGAVQYSQVKDPDFIIFKLMQENPNLFEKYYNIDAKGDSEVLIEEYGRKNNLLRKGNKVNIDKASRFILKDWQEEKIKG